LYVILGATGNTGSVVANTLLNKGKRIRVVGRDSRKLAPFVSRGADAFVADAVDAQALGRAFAGAEGVYALIPPNHTSDDYRRYQDQVTDAIVTAIEAAGVKHAVTLSSFGADKPDKTGPIAGLHTMETRLNRIEGLNVLHLRAGYFMENTVPQVGAIQSFGMMAGPVDAELPLPMIATKDIGVVAAEALLKLDFNGKRMQELQGQRNLNYTEAAKIIGEGIGKPGLAYVRLPDDQVTQALSSMGMSKNFAALIVEMANAMNSGYVKALEPRSAKSTTPTSFEQFVREVFVPAYKGQAAGA
jgi:uncharacterized protein YbjT (DUF2867 family)